MPPKVRFTREKIEETAYLMAKERGLDAVAAREVAKAMHMTVTPIFTYFSGMEELKRTVRDRVRREFREYLQESAEYTPAFLEFCMRWIRYAAENPNLYGLLMHTGGGICQMDELLELFPEIVEPIEKEISGLFVLSPEEAHTLLRHMMIYAHGVADFYLCGGEDPRRHERNLSGPGRQNQDPERHGRYGYGKDHAVLRRFEAEEKLKQRPFLIFGRDAFFVFPLDIRGKCGMMMVQQFNNCLIVK